MAGSFATVDDLAALWRSLSAGERERAEKLLPIVSDNLRQEARNRGYDLDDMIKSGLLLGSVAKSVTIDVATRVLSTPTDEAPMSQFSQGALGYTVSGTYLTPGGGIYIKRAELSRLGILRQRIRGVQVYDTPKGYHGDADTEGTDRG
nr:Gp19/Gp15/Gp42 family protein [uncultured Dysosmobacter sp.]